MDHGNRVYPISGIVKCASRINPTCVVKPAGDGRGICSTMKSESKVRVIAHNRKARFNYQIGETFEVGLALTGTEVKSLRGGKATIAEAYADSRGGEIWLVNANIPEYLQGGRFNHAPKRVRKLLLHRRQINKLIGAVEREGMTLVPLSSISTTRAAPSLSLRSPAARSCTTSARPRTSAAGSASADGCYGPRDNRWRSLLRR